MINTTQHIALQGAGLNGFWGSIWNAFKQKLGISVSDGSIDNSFGRRLGNLLAGALDTATGGGASIIGGIIGGTFKDSLYEPTAQEMTILNPIIASLNDFVFGLSTDCDNALKSNQSAQYKVSVLNNAIRKLQLVQNHFSGQPLTTISANAQIYLSNEILGMEILFEATIEDLLRGNNIEFTKVEGDLAVNSADSYPAIIKPNSNVYGYGIQYQIPGDIQTLTGNVPTQTDNENIPITLVEPTETTTQVAGLENNKSSSSILITVILFASAIALALSGGSKKEKN